MWTSNKLQYINSFCLTKRIDNKIHWSKVESEGLLLEDDYFMIEDNYERSILTEDYEFYMNIKGKYVNFTPEIISELEQKTWGNNIS